MHNFVITFKGMELYPLNICMNCVVQIIYSNKAVKKETVRAPTVQTLFDGPTGATWKTLSEVKGEKCLKK